MIVNATIRGGLLAAFAACSGAQRDPAIVNSKAHGACPAAKDVWLASFAGHQTIDGVTDPGHGWFLPLGSKYIDEPATPADPAATAEAPMTAEEAATWIPPGRPWMLRPGHAPCALSYGAKYVAVVADGPWNRSFRVELKDCPLPEDGKGAAAIVVMSASEPDECHVALAHRVSTHTDWTGARRAERVPAELAPLVGTPGPGQVLLWRIDAVEVHGEAVFWSIDTSNITVGATNDECNWLASNLGMLYIRARDRGSAIVPFTYAHDPEEERRGGAMEVHQSLFAALVDTRGLRSVMMTNLGEYQVYDLTEKPFRIGHHVRWYIPNEEDYASDGVLGPYCGP